MQQPSYPDITDVLSRKERGRHATARLSFAEKLDLLDRLRANEELLAAAMRKSARLVSKRESA